MLKVILATCILFFNQTPKDIRALNLLDTKSDMLKT